MNVKKSCCLILLLFVMTGCAAKQELPRFVWPVPPEQPRLEFVGNYYSAIDLQGAGKRRAATTLLGADRAFEFTTPFGIVSDGKGRVYVSDTHEDNIRIFDFNTKKSLALTARKLFVNPAGLALDKAGNLFVADLGAAKIFCFDSKGEFRRLIESDVLGKPAYLALSPDETRLYVSDVGTHQIHIFNAATGSFIKSFGERGAAAGQLYSPQGLAFSKSGSLYVADTLNARIQAFDPEGNFLLEFGSRGDLLEQFVSPKDLSFDSEGHLYVVDARSSTLKTFTPEGVLLLVTSAGENTTNPFGFAAPKAVFIDRQDRIYVAESLGKRFSIWQYMSDAYLKSNPYTDADRQQLLRYMEKVAREKAN